MEKEKVTSSSGYCKLYRAGSSVVLVIPRSVLNRAGFQLGQTVWVSSHTAGVVRVESLPGYDASKKKEGGESE